MDTLKRFKGCGGIGKLYFVFSLDGYLTPGSACSLSSSIPTGFDQLIDFNGNLYGFIVDLSTASHTVQEVTIFASDGTTDYYFLLEFDLTTTCVTEQEVCCNEDSLNIRWLGREGGIKQWTFTGVKSYDVKVGQANQFKNNSLQVQYSQRSNIYYGKVITSGNITRAQADFLDELKYSIQAWEVQEDDTVLPILINNESFDKYKSTQKFYDVSLAYIAAEEVRVQTQ